MERKNERLPIFTERFRELQGEQSNTEFAEFLGISRQTVGFYWNGDRVPDAVTLVKIAERCNVSADWLLGLSNTKALVGDLKQVCNYTGLPQKAVEYLNSLQLHDGPKNEVAFELINQVIKASSMYRDCVWRAALARIQGERLIAEVETRKQQSDEYLEYWDKKDLSDIEKALDRTGDEIFGIEIPVWDAYRLFRTQAIENVRYAAEMVLSDYCDKIVDMLTKKEDSIK